MLKTIQTCPAFVYMCLTVFSSCLSLIRMVRSGFNGVHMFVFVLQFFPMVLKLVNATIAIMWKQIHFGFVIFSPRSFTWFCTVSRPIYVYTLLHHIKRERGNLIICVASRWEEEILHRQYDKDELKIFDIMTECIECIES